MMACAYYDPKKLSRYEQNWKMRALSRVPAQKTIEELSQEADELYLLHESRKRPVS